MRFNITILFILISVGNLSAQESMQYSFKHFSVTNGLASNTVSTAMQDKDGFIWIGTINGLQRYDGSSFITFKSKSNDPHSIPSNHIISIFKDRNKRLWIVGDNYKIGIFDTKKFVFTEANINSEDRKYFIPQNFLELPSGKSMLLKEDGNLLEYVENENRFVLAKNALPGPRNWKRRSIVFDSARKKYWMSCDSGFAVYDMVTKHLNYRGHNIDNDPVITQFGHLMNSSHIFLEKSGDIIFSNWPKDSGGGLLYRYSFKRKTGEGFYIGYPGYHEIMGWMQQKNGRLWSFGNPFFAEWIDEPGSKGIKFIPNEYKNEQTLKFDYAFSCFEDRESNIWISTDNGLFLFNPDAQVFSSYFLVQPNKQSFEAPVQAIEEMPDGKVFVGCWGGGGLTCYDLNFNPLPLPAPFPDGNVSVWDMAVNIKTGDLWVTLQGGGIVVYSPKQNKYTKLFPEVFDGSTIRQVDEDTSGNMWFGTHSGRVIKWDLEKANNDPSKGYEFVYQTGLVHKIHYDYQGYIWVATLGNGLLKIDAKTKKLLKTFTATGKEGERLFTNSPHDMTYYNDSTLILSAGCVNILNTKTNKISFITAEDGLPSNTVVSVEKDKTGIIWIGMTNGLCRLNVEKKLITYYDRRDGIMHDKFDEAGIKEFSDGRLAFFTDHNFLVFDPEKFGQQHRPPKPIITGFKLGGISLSVDSIQLTRRAVLRYNNTSISINFSALSFLPQQKTHYYYMLENLDKDWIKTDRPIEVVYNYLPPGNYIFKVKSENADGIPNEEIASFTITVRAPVWKTWWFYSLIALLIVAILYLLDRERMNKRRSLQQMRSQIGLNLHDEVSMTLSNINVLSEIAKIKADKNIEQSKDFIDQISDKSRHMMEAMDDMLWSIDPENDSMKKTILRIKETTDGFRSANNVDIDLIVDHKVEGLQLDMKQRHEMYFYYKEAMSFAVQNLRCGQIFVSLNKMGSKILVEILAECNNVDDFSAAFRKAVDKRVKALNANLDVAADNKSFAAALYVDAK